MSYIVVVNPAILKAAGVPAGPSMVATILTAVFGTLLMGLYAKLPFAIAPYMGENAFLAYTVVQALGFSWQAALAAILLAGVVFLVLTVVRLSAVARGRDSFRLALQLCGWNRTVSDIYRLESNRCCYVGKCGSAVEGGPSYSRPGPSRHLRFLADGSADDPPLSRRHSDRHPRDRVSGLRNSRGTSAKSVGELAPQHFSDTVQRGFSSSTELGILPDCAHDFYYGLRGHDGYADWSVGTRGISG